MFVISGYTIDLQQNFYMYHKFIDVLLYVKQMHFETVLSNEETTAHAAQQWPLSILYKPM
jgi:hypothetical protein